jgi:hypothetical protein
MMTVNVNSWWVFLCAVGALNIIAWSLSAVALRRKQGLVPGEVYAIRRWQLLLSAVYVFGCAFRSAFPVYDVPRITLYDSWISSVVVGRSVATLAELCFVAQWAVMLREVSRATGSTVGRSVSLMVVPLIAIAECCSWYSVLTTSNIGHVAEETLWGLCAAMLVVSLVAMRSHCTRSLRYLLDAGCVAGIAYVAFMFLVDVPMYWSRWIVDEAIGRHYLTLAQGFLDVSHRWSVSFRVEDWKNEFAWMSLYFSVAVWFSISLIHAPVPQKRLIIDESRHLPSAA